MVQAFAPVADSEQARKAVEVFADRIRERNLDIRSDGYGVLFKIDVGLENESFTIRSTESGVEILSGDVLGLLHGAGFFLRHTEFADSGTEPCAWRGSQTPKCAIRGTYFASHFFNFYHVAPYDEMKRYIEDLALWGFNNVMAIFPFADMQNADDPACDVFIDRLNAIFGMVHDLGMKATTSFSNNSTYPGFPEQYRAKPIEDPTRLRTNHGYLMCPSIPEANQMLLDDIGKVMSKLQPSNIDIIMTWPYDEGGCGCEQCHPWGKKGFLRTSRQIFELVGALLPNAQRCLATWLFDTPDEGEWEALAASLENDKWLDIILADSHTDFPAYPLAKGVPGNLQMINFPEVSMWGLFPWGGWGATPLPERFTRLWRQASHILSGGFIYSEGIFEDINKMVISQLYWHGDADWKETLRQYARYEFGLTDGCDFIELAALIERTHTEVAETGKCDIAVSDRAFDIAQAIDARLAGWAGASWRWRIVYLRALLDARRFRIAKDLNTDTSWSDLPWKTLLRDDEPVQKAFREIIALFHCSKKERGDKYHVRVRPLCD